MTTLSILISAIGVMLFTFHYGTDLRSALCAAATVFVAFCGGLCTVDGLRGSRTREPFFNGATRMIIGISALVTALGGGSLRCLMLYKNPLTFWPSHLDVVGAAVLGATIVLTLHRDFNSAEKKLINRLDDCAIGIFAPIGAEYGAQMAGINASFSIIVCCAMILGVITAFGGGWLRDLFLLKQPPVFSASKLLAAALGSGLYVVLAAFELPACWIVSGIITAVWLFLLNPRK